MGEWSQTAYVKSSAEALCEALVHIFRKEDRILVEKRSTKPSTRFDSMQYGHAEDNRLWAVAVLPGLDGWQVVKTAPFELLCERAARAEAPRLVSLCRELKCPGLQLNMYDGDSLVLLEAGASGRFVVSGGVASQEDPFEFHDETIHDAHFKAGFRLLRIPNVEEDAFDGGCMEAVELLADALAGESAEWASNNYIQLETLIPRKELDPSVGRILYFTFEPRLRTGVRGKKPSDE